MFARVNYAVNGSPSILLISFLMILLVVFYWLVVDD